MTREDEIFKKLKRGDKSGIEDLVRMYYDDILWYCRFRVPDRAAAEDAVQETFLKVFRHLDTYRHRGKFRAFLYQVAANTCIDTCRKRRWDSLEEEVPSRRREIEEKEEEEDFLRMIRSLPPGLGEIVFLRFSQELKLREIAELTDTPLRTVQSRLRRALKLLKTGLESVDENRKGGAKDVENGREKRDGKKAEKRV